MNTTVRITLNGYDKFELSIVNVNSLLHSTDWGFEAWQSRFDSKIRQTSISPSPFSGRSYVSPKLLFSVAMRDHFHYGVLTSYRPIYILELRYLRETLLHNGLSL
jgi:hypothetical protein